MKNSNKKTKARIPCFVKQREGPGDHKEDTRTESRGMQEGSPCVEVPGPIRCTIQEERITAENVPEHHAHIGGVLPIAPMSN
jgi:hypothetical protein